MANQLIVYKGRTNIVPVSLGVDVEGDTITSEIRTEPNSESALIATWTVDVVTDGSDGEITLTLDNAVTSLISVDSGYMDIKRLVGSEPIPVFEKPIEVVFRASVTV